jgi:hypothetical protein
VEGEEEDEGGNLWYVGVFISICGSIFNNLGQNVQKLAQDKDPDAAYIYLPLWWAGLGLVIFGSLGDVISLTFAPQSVVMPVGSFTLAANIFFANRFFGETLSKQDVLGTLLIVIGATGVAVAYGVLGDVPAQCFDLDDLIQLYDAEIMWIYGAVVFGLIFFFKRITSRCHKILSEKHNAQEEGTAQHTQHALCSYTTHTMLIHYTHYTHTLHTLCSYTTHTMLIHYTHYAHTLHTLCSYTTHTMLIH